MHSKLLTILFLGTLVGCGGGSSSGGGEALDDAENNGSGTIGSNSDANNDSGANGDNGGSGTNNGSGANGGNGGQGADGGNGGNGSNPDSGSGGGSGGAGPGTGTGISNTVSGPARMVGLVSISQSNDSFTGSQEVNLNAGFLSTNAPIPSASLIQEFRPTLDTCEVDRTDITDFDFPDFNDLGIQVNFVSAGSNIVFTGTGGTYATLDKTVQFGSTFYATETELPTPLPGNLEFDIPGDVFPAFPNIAVPKVDPLTGVPASGLQQVTANTVFQWDAGSNPDAYITISAGGGFDIFNPTATSVSVSCIVRDDGSFSFPASTQSELGASFSAFFATIDRTLVSFRQKGNTLLVIQSTASN